MAKSGGLEFKWH